MDNTLDLYQIVTAVEFGLSTLGSYGGPPPLVSRVDDDTLRIEAGDRAFDVIVRELAA